MPRFESDTGWVDAVQFDGTNAIDILDFAGAGAVEADHNGGEMVLEVEGRNVLVDKGQWVIREKAGAVYVVSNQEMFTNYRAADGDEAAEPEESTDDIYDFLWEFCNGWEGCVQGDEDPVLYGELRLTHVERARDEIDRLRGRLEMYEGGEDEDDAE